MRPTELRGDIPALEDLTYMNFGASGPSPRRVVEAAADCQAHHEYESPGEDGMYPAAFDAYEEAREVIASLVDVAPQEIALTQSTSDGINRFICSLEWEPGDTIVRTDMEHPAGILPLQRLERVRDTEIRIVGSDAGRIDIESFTTAVRGAKLVVLSALSWNFGTRLPVETLVDIAHDSGALVLVDAVQWPGQAPVSYADWGADAVAAAGHKWLLGPWGAGFLHVNESIAETLEPGTIGYRSVNEPTACGYELAPGATRFEMGTINPAPHTALREAIEIFQNLGEAAIEERIHTLACRLVDQLPEHRLLSPSTPESGLVTIDVDDPAATVRELGEQGIVIRSLTTPDSVRASIHAVNTEAEVDGLVDALEPHLR